MQVTEVTATYITSIPVPQILVQVEPHFAAIMHQYLREKVAIRGTPWTHLVF